MTLIGITTSLWPAGRHGLPYVMLGAQYLQAVERAGATAVLLSPAHGLPARERLLDTIDGLLLSGGEDVDPSRYGQAAHAALGTTNPERDAFELDVLAGALERGLPVMAICRGMQLLNVAGGGTLFQDLSAQRPGSVEHTQRAELHQPWHRVHVVSGSRLHAIVGADELRVNSFHHQAIDRLADSLTAVARSDDSVVEAVEAKDGWVLGLQWHPERGSGTADGASDPYPAVFDAFVGKCRARGAETPVLR